MQCSTNVLSTTTICAPTDTGLVAKPLQPPETALTVYWKNGKVATTDGPYAETKETLGGIMVLEARDMNHAIQLMSHHPSMKYGSFFDILPTFDMKEMMQASEQRRRNHTAR